MIKGYLGFIEEIKDKKVAIIGMGISNLPVPEFLFKCGARHVACFDRNFNENTNKMTEELKSQGYDVSYYGGDDYLSKIGTGYDYLFRSPGIRPDVPELVGAAKVMTSEMEMFLKYCPAKVYGVTGSDGKTTTTTLTSLFLKSVIEPKGGKVYLGGNIGTPLLNKLGEITENDRVCVELSSFQLIEMKTAVDVAIITNVTPNHLNYHLSYDEYLESKANILNFRQGTGIIVLNRGNKDSERYFGRKGTIRTFSAKKDIGEGDGAYYRDGEIFYQENGKSFHLLNTDEILIRGTFNWENYMAAYCAVKDEVPEANIAKIAAQFGGVKHRMEFVRELHGVKYYNSSIDSSPERTKNALSVYDKKVVLIAGGKDKGISYDDIGPVICDKVRAMILTGPTAVLIENAARKECERRNIPYNIETIHCKTYDEAVLAAQNVAKPGENVILSPASTSFDMFKNFEERGETFKKLVLQLK